MEAANHSVTQRDAVAGDEGFRQLAVQVEVLGVAAAILVLADMAQIRAIPCQGIEHLANVADDVLVLLARELGDLA
ncbi:hypothetical protein D9M69_722270 [compost metagenome]